MINFSRSDVDGLVLPPPLVGVCIYVLIQEVIVYSYIFYKLKLFVYYLRFIVVIVPVYLRIVKIS